jgi:integration host factor subunit alpha
MTLTKADLVDALYEVLDFRRVESLQTVESLLEIIKQTLENGEDVLISGFGKFCVKEKAQRKGRNPATGDDLILSPRKVVTFKCSPVLREKMNFPWYRR